jgi:betaine reductase
MSDNPVVAASVAVLAHTPGMAELGSKPSRELPKDPGLRDQFLSSLRSYEDAVRYSPHQAYIGGLHPRDMAPRPWVGRGPAESERYGPDGEVMPEEEVLALCAAVDEFQLLVLSPSMADRALAALSSHPYAKTLDLERAAKAAGDIEAVGAERGNILIRAASGEPIAAMRRGHEADDSLTAAVLLENLVCKASGVLALLHLVGRGVDPDSVDYVIGCAEEAVGDRYQRGGGNMGKAMAAAAGLTQASGADVKNFCAAPVPALVVAGALVKAGVFNRVVVAAGGSLPKLGMKFQGHLRHELPVLEDVIGGSATLVERNDGASPQLRLDLVGRHPVKAGSSNPQIMEALGVEPLRRGGLRMTDVDDYATELHNPEITEPQGSGNVPERNYKTIAALAARAGDIERADIPAFMEQRGMPGFAPTQGHLASALCYLPHAIRRLGPGEAERVLMIAKGSLFLGRMTQLSDGMSLLVERNSG